MQKNTPLSWQKRASKIGFVTKKGFPVFSFGFIP